MSHPIQSNESLTVELFNLNLAHLTLLKKVADANLSEAVLRFGITRDVASAVRDAHSRTLVEIASNGQSLWALRVDAEEVRRAADRAQASSHKVAP